MASALGGSFEGKLVEINANGNVVRVAQEEEDGSYTELEDQVMDGQRGLCVGFSDYQGEYTVQLFEGPVVSCSEDCLALWIPDAAPEDGGSDLIWTRESLPHAVFGTVVSDNLRKKGFCAIETEIDSITISKALGSIEGLEDFDRIREETAIDYLGRDNFTKVKQMDDDVPDEDPKGALGECDRYLSNLGVLLEPEAADAFGYTLIGRTSGFARVMCSDKAEAAALTPPYTDDEVASGRVEGFFQWIQSRKICMVLVLQSEGGELVLHPRPGQGGDIKLPLLENRLVLFRHDTMSYSYKPQGNGVILQAWLLTGLPSVELRSITGEQKDYAENLGLTGPWQPEGAQALIKSLMVRLPGRSWGFYNYWNMFSAGTDCVLEWTNTRWDTEEYYEPDRDMAMMTGKSYMHHGGFLDESEFNCFDNEFFGYTEDQSRAMYPGQRITLETGYESLFRAGYTRSQAAGEHIAVQAGDVGPDWHSVDTCWPYMIEGGDFTDKRMGVNAGVTCTRLSHFLNLTGPTNSVATACSSSLVALNIAHHNMANFRDDKIRLASGKDVYERALIIGLNTLMGPFSFMGQCGMGGTTYKGRSFTFDVGADGYQRGEGCSATFIQMFSGEPKNADRLACVIGTAVNQDGRSASLTAPNGPSQSALCKAAMAMAKLTPVEVTAAECHGTGTALGDPIEIGALQGVLSKRDRAILKTSAKSNMAHLEAAAGMAGFAKCILMILASTTPPNQHLKVLNPHLIVEGYPVCFTTELTPWGQNSGYCGVSSFGIGGTNARGEIVGRCQRGPEDTGRTLNDLRHRNVDFVTMRCPRCEGKMLFPSGSAVPQPLMAVPKSPGAEDALAVPGSTPKLGKYRCTLIRDEFADYSWCSDCYQDTSQGEFRCGGELEGMRNPGRTLYARGSWDGFYNLFEIEEDITGTYVFHLVLGETRCERFHISVEQARNLMLYPARDNGGQFCRIQGPDNEGLERCWMIDARDTDAPPGTVYKVTFVWDGDRKRISWEPVTETEELPEVVLGKGLAHRYEVIGSWTSFKPMEMVPSKTNKTILEATFYMGPYGMEEFHFQRDQDPRQAIYPAILTHEAYNPDSLVNRRDGAGKMPNPDQPLRWGTRPTPASVPLRGPDPHSKDKRIVVHGKEGEKNKIQLQVVDAHITVTVTAQSTGTRRWESKDGLNRQLYYITGDFNDGGLAAMVPDDNEVGTYVYDLQLQDFSASFEMMIDADPKRRMYPQLPKCASGEGFLEGPDAGPANSDARYWQVQGQPGMTFRIRFDPKAEDKRKMVTWKSPDLMALELA